MVFLPLLFVSCGKTNDWPTEETFDRYPAWLDDESNNDFWNKQQGGGFQIDTAWDGDTTINF